MATKKNKQKLSFGEILRRIKHSGLGDAPAIDTVLNHDLEGLTSLAERIHEVFKIYKTEKTSSKMIFFIMYDIENDKIRNQIAKYLIKKGCVRVQKSIFLAQLDRNLYNELHNTLKEVQDVYDNFDSIFFVPVSTDEIKAMKVIGSSIDFDFILENKNTLFF